jgi:hypothetical protein
MNNWNQLLSTLDKTVGFPNKISSTVKRRWQGYDLYKNEHVIWLEYRVKVHPGIFPPQRGPERLRDLHGKPKPIVPRRQLGAMATIRELMDLESADTKDSTPSLPSRKNGKRTTEKSSLRPNRIRSKSSASPTRPA